jgi:hypothetical protein
MAAEGGSAQAQAQLGVWHLKGWEGLEPDNVKAALWFGKAADLGDAFAQKCLAMCYLQGEGVDRNDALAAEWMRKAADQGDEVAQFAVGKWYARGEVGVKKDLHLGKRFLELSAAQGREDAAEVLKELRKCVACGSLDVHHMVCSRCHNKRYCDAMCQGRHWESTTDPHKLHCVKRLESAGAGGSDRVEPPPHLNLLMD